MKKILLIIINWTWCLPQNLVALILRIFVKVEDVEVGSWSKIYNTNLKCGSISLGNHVFLCKGHWNNLQVINHELGHCKQSYILGPLYLLVIGLPSLIWAGCFGKYRAKHNISYYSFYTEKWADKLAGIER